MTSSPKISVLTPVYNCVKYLDRCILSVQAQGYSNFEHIVIDGNSSDGTIDILKRYPHLTWISEPDSGEANALNKAIRMASGDLCVWLNGDDWLEPGAFASVVRAMTTNPKTEVFYGQVRMVDESAASYWVKMPLQNIGQPELLRWWLCNNHPHQPGMYFTREAMARGGLFDEALHFSIDYEYWLRLAPTCTYSYVDAVLANALIRTHCKSAGTEVGQVQSHWKVLLPHLRTLAKTEQIQYWRDYFEHRAYNPMPYEKTRLPDDDAALDGLVKFLTEQPGSQLGIRFEAIFTDPDSKNLATTRIEDYALRQGGGVR
jgi:glycosyltransferase involved in cell wall biosynthesis